MKKEIDFTKLVHPESLEFSDVDDDSGAGDYDSSESEESGTDEKTIESAEEKENEPYSSDDETSYPASEDEDEEKKEEQDESDIDLSSGEESAMESVEAESDDGSKGLEDSDDSEDDSVDKSDDETNVYGEIVDTHENPKFSTIFSLATKKMVTSAHVTDSKGNSIVYMLDEVGTRNRLKHLLQKKKRGYSWILRNNNRSANVTKREKGLCEGFNPEPSSEEEESENESSEEENEGDTRSQAKQGKDSKLKNNKKKENKQTKKKAKRANVQLPALGPATQPLSTKQEGAGVLSTEYMIVRNRPYCHGCGLEHCSSGSQCCSRCSTRLLHDEEPLRRTWSLATLFDGTSSALHDICEWVARGTSVPFHHKFSVELNDDCDDFLRELQKKKVYAHVRSNSRHSDFLELSLAAFLEVVLLIITPPCERFSSLFIHEQGHPNGPW